MGRHGSRSVWSGSLSRIASQVITERNSTAKGLSYKIPACHARRMNHESNWKDRAEAANYWLLSAVVGGAFIAGLVSAISYLTG
jgi:hypothetical protein